MAAASGLLRFVPVSKPVSSHDIAKFQQFFNSAKGKLLVLTGAGLSTESGIPDYRSENVGLYARTNRRPVQYTEFVKSSAARQRYWARSFIGWPRFSSFQPNASHYALAALEKNGALDWIITQNVDQLHQKAGSQRVIELHGSLYRIVCLTCDLRMSRFDLQKLFLEANPGWQASDQHDQMAPDGDVLLTDEQVKSFQVPSCPSCGGVLKPDVVFFGDNVATQLVDHVYELISFSDNILVAGSSLYVYSGYRFVQRAKSLGKNVAIINIGSTRADDIADLKIDSRCSEILTNICF